MKNKIKGINFDEDYYTDVNHPFLSKPKFSTPGSNIELSSQGPMITFEPDDSIGDVLEFDKITIYEEYILSPNPVDILSFDNFFL